MQAIQSGLGDGQNGAGGFANPGDHGLGGGYTGGIKDITGGKTGGFKDITGQHDIPYPLLVPGNLCPVDGWFNKRMMHFTFRPSVWQVVI